MKNFLTEYWPFIVVVCFIVYVKYKRSAVGKMLPELLAQGGVVIDVRSEGEFASGHYPNSMNIPLGQISARLNDIPKDKPLVLCCASGTRSGMAARMLKSKGFNAFNAGAWTGLK